MFIEFQKAYDSVPQEALWRGLQLISVLPSLVQLILSFHYTMFANVRVGGSHTGEIQVCNGLQQGCFMAVVLF